MLYEVITITLGAAILGKVGGEMIITDPWIHKTFHPAHWMDYAMQAVCAVGVVLVGKYLVRRKIAQSEKEVATSNQVPVSENE